MLICYLRLLDIVFSVDLTGTLEMSEQIDSNREMFEKYDGTRIYWKIKQSFQTTYLIFVHLAGS